MRPLLLFPIFATAMAFAEDSPVPVAHSVERYTEMMESSPFALATVQAAPKEPEASFAANWNVTGLAKIPDSNGVAHDWVMIRSRDQRVYFALYGTEPSDEPEAEGVQIASVDWNANDPRKSVVTLKKGNQFAKVEFGEETAPASNPADFGGNPNTGITPPRGAGSASFGMGSPGVGRPGSTGAYTPPRNPAMGSRDPAAPSPGGRLAPQLARPLDPLPNYPQSNVPVNIPPPGAQGNFPRVRQLPAP